MIHASDLEWVNDYVGVPYVRNGRTRAGWDCWGVVLAVYRDRLGLELPDWQYQVPFEREQFLDSIEGAIGAEAERVEVIEAPEQWALGLVHYAARPHHVGVVVGNSVLHAQPYCGTVCDPLPRFMAHYARTTWHRWRR